MSEIVYRNPEIRILPSNEEILAAAYRWQEPLGRYFKALDAYLSPVFQTEQGAQDFIRDSLAILLDTKQEFKELIIDPPGSSPERRSALLMSIDYLEKLVPMFLKAWGEREFGVSPPKQLIENKNSILKHLSTYFELMIRHALWTNADGGVVLDRREEYNTQMIRRMAWRKADDNNDEVLYNPIFQEDVADRHPDWKKQGWSNIVDLARIYGDCRELRLRDGLRYLQELSTLVFEEGQIDLLKVLNNPNDANNFKICRRQFKDGVGVQAYQDPESLTVEQGRLLSLHLDLLLRGLWLYSRTLRPDYVAPVSKTEAAAE